MSKMSELAAELAELKHCGESLIRIADSLADMFSGAEEPEQTPVKKTAGKKAQKSAVKAETEAKPLTLEEVRMVLADKSRNGHTAEVKALLLKHGADKLSDIDPANYPALLADAEVL